MADPAEQELLQRVPSGDDRAFEQLYGLYEARLKLVAWRIRKRPDVADDLANETWMRAYNVRATFDPARGFLNWLGGILQNVWREHARATVREPAGQANPTEPGDDTVSPETAIVEAELFAGLNDCVNRLSAAEQDLVRWRFFDGQSLRHIAQRLGIAEATLREHRLSDVMTKLERCLKSKGLAHFFSFSAAQQGGVLQYKVGDDS